MERTYMSAVFTSSRSRNRGMPTNTVPCPRCGDMVTEFLGPVNSILDWFRCLLCRHIWARHPTND